MVEVELVGGHAWHLKRRLMSARTSFASLTTPPLRGFLAGFTGRFDVPSQFLQTLGAASYCHCASGNVLYILGPSAYTVCLKALKEDLCLPCVCRVPPFAGLLKAMFHFSALFGR